MVKNTKFLVTGGAGFIGSNLVEELLKLNNTIIVVDDLSTGCRKNLPNDQNLFFIENKVQDINFDLNDIEGIFHLAAQTSVPLSIDDFYTSSSNNLLSSLKIFDIAKKLNIPIVFASSSAVYGNLPFGDDEDTIIEILSPYAQDKITLEEYSKIFFNIYGISSIGLRFFNVYGPKQDPNNPYSGVISIFIENFLRKRPVIIYGGYQTRDFIFVKDVVKTMIRAMEFLRNNQFNDFINVGTGVSITIENLYFILKDIFGYEVERIYKPLPFGDPEKSSGNFNKLKNILGVDNKNFITLEQGLSHTINYMKNL